MTTKDPNDGADLPETFTESFRWLTGKRVADEVDGETYDEEIPAFLTVEVVDDEPTIAALHFPGGITPGQIREIAWSRVLDQVVATHRAWLRVRDRSGNYDVRATADDLAWARGSRRRNNQATDEMYEQVASCLTWTADRPPSPQG